MAVAEAFKTLCVETGEESRVDNSSIDAALLQLFSHSHGKSKEIAHTDDCHTAAAMSHLKTIHLRLIVGREVNAARPSHASGRHTYSHRMLSLLDAPVEHCQIFLTACRRKVDHIRDV